MQMKALEERRVSKCSNSRACVVTNTHCRANQWFASKNDFSPSSENDSRLRVSPWFILLCLCYRFSLTKFDLILNRFPHIERETTAYISSLQTSLKSVLLATYPTGKHNSKTLHFSKLQIVFQCFMHWKSAKLYFKTLNTISLIIILHHALMKHHNII